MASRSTQKGMSALLLLFVLVSFGLILTCLFRLGPAYLDNFYIRDALRSLAKDHPEDLTEISKDTIRQELSEYYSMNNVRGDAAKALEVERKKDKTLIMVNYEVRVPLLANVDAVVKFENVLDTSRPDECCDPPEKP